MKSFISILLICSFFVANVHADGCFPGDPCYVKPKPMAPPPAYKPKPMMKKKPMAAAPMSKTPGFYVAAGVAYNFLEKDEEILGHLDYNLKIGAYRFLENLSAEFGFALMPDIRNREHPSPGAFALADDTEGERYSLEFLYHLDSEGASKQVDPYVALGVGLNEYDDDLAEGDNAVFLSTGLGAFVNITDTFFVKPDYRLMMVGDDTEVNHNVGAAVGLRF